MYMVQRCIMASKWTGVNEDQPSKIPGQSEEDVVKNFTATVAMVHHDLHSEGFFTWLVGEDDHNSSVHVIQVDQVCALY